MPITIDRADVADHPAILALMHEARGEDLNDEQRACRGFVQGQMDESMLAHFEAGSGVFVARDGEALAGVCMTSLPGMVEDGPPAETVAALQQGMSDARLDRLFPYGPVVVDRRYQGRGLLTRLLVGACAALQDRFEMGAAFVEYSNRKSLAIHRHYPMAESASFTFKARDYSVFTFSPKQVTNHYR